MSKKKKKVWVIVAHFAGCDPEVVDEYHEKDYAQELLKEYRKAFGKRTKVWMREK